MLINADFVLDKKDNEGGEGYTPHIISKEEYENAKKVLSHH